MTLKLHRPDGRGGLEERPVVEKNWQRGLRSSRWGASLRGGRLPRLENREMNPTSPWIAVGLWVGLAAVTFAILVVGYGSGFWG